MVVLEHVGFGVTLRENLLHSLLEVVALDEELRVLARVHRAAAAGAVVVVVEQVYGAETGHGHTSLTLVAPYIVGISDVQVVLALLAGIVAAAHEIAHLVVIGAGGVVEHTPADGDEVGLHRHIQVAVHAIREAAMVNPDVLGAVANRHQVVPAHVDGAGPYEVDVADDDVALAGDVEDARLAICLAAVAQIVDKQLAHLRLACFAHRRAIGQCASRAARCGQAVHIVVVHQLADVVAHVEFRTDACIVDTHNRAVRGTEVDVSRHHEVACRAIEHHHGILRNGIVERIVVVSARGL